MIAQLAIGESRKTVAVAPVIVESEEEDTDTMRRAAER